MRSTFKRRYSLLIVAIAFVFVRFVWPEFLNTRDYITSYTLFLYFARPLLFDRSIFDILERFLPETIREGVKARRQTRETRGQIAFNRMVVALLLTSIAAVAPASIILDNLAEALSLQEEASSDLGVVDSLFRRATVLLLIAIFWMLMFCNLLKSYFLETSIIARDDSSMEFRICRVIVNSFFAIFMSFVLLAASYLSGFISANVGFRIMLTVQSVVWIALTSGRRFLRKRLCESGSLASRLSSEHRLAISR